jgi:hypothetical protein
MISIRRAVLIVVVIGSIGGLAWYAATHRTIPSSGGRVASISFYGTSGVDVEAVRAKLPLKEGDPVPEFATDGFGAMVESFEKATGYVPNIVCCDDRLNKWVFIGLGGYDVPTLPSPLGENRLPGGMLDLFDEFEKARMESVAGGNFKEDRGEGYALANDPVLRAVQIRLREVALMNDREIFSVLETSGDIRSRQAAAHFLGYVQRSKRQAEALARASQDSDEEVRNNATRALAVLLGAFPETGVGLDFEYFFDLLNSTSWTDRNKASALVEVVSRARDPQVASRIRARAMDALIDMAEWKSPHREPALWILGRISGMEEASLSDKMGRGRYEEILATVR